MLGATIFESQKKVERLFLEGTTNRSWRKVFLKYFLLSSALGTAREVDFSVFFCYTRCVAVKNSLTI